MDARSDTHRPVEAIGRFFLLRGLTQYSCATHDAAPNDSLHILQKREKKPWWDFSRFCRDVPRQSILGTIWFSNVEKGANDRHWVLDVYGKENAEAARKIAGEINAVFKVRVTIHLTTAERHHGNIR